jgi:hypothetical protein
MNKLFKNSILLSAFALASTFAFAQKPGEGEKTAEVLLNLQIGDSPISYGLNSNGGGAPAEIRLRYFLSDMGAVRLRLGLGGGSTTTNVAGSGVDATVKTTNGFGLAFFPGYEMHFEGTNKLSPYVGAQLGITMIGGKTIAVTNAINPNPQFGDVIEGNKYYEKTGSTFGFSAGIMMGADYYLFDGVYIGGEFGLGLFSMSSTGEGDIKTTLNGGSPTTTKILGTSSNSYFGASAGGVRLGIKF